MDDSDPGEVDIEEHITRGPGGSILFSQTQRSGPRRRTTFRRGDRGQSPGGDNPDAVMQSFQDMIGSLIGPNLRAGQTGRSGQENDLFAPPRADDPFPHATRFGGDGPGPTVNGGRPAIFNGRFAYTYTSTPQRRNANGEPDGADQLSQYVPYSFTKPVEGCFSGY